MSVKSDYAKVKVGQYVYLRRQLENQGGQILAKGLLMQVMNKHRGLHLDSVHEQPCSSCGTAQRGRISHISVVDVVVLPIHTRVRTSRRVIPDCGCIWDDKTACGTHRERSDSRGTDDLVGRADDENTVGGVGNAPKVPTCFCPCHNKLR